MAAKGPARASLRYAKAPLSPRYQWELHQLLGHCYTGGIHRAKLTVAINRGDMSGAGFMEWLKPKEIIKQRKAEQALFCTGDYDANGNSIPIWPVDEHGRLRGIYKTIIGAELRRLMAFTGASRTPAASPAIDAPPAACWASSIATLSRNFKRK